MSPVSDQASSFQYSASAHQVSALVSATKEELQYQVLEAHLAQHQRRHPSAAQETVVAVIETSMVLDKNSDSALAVEVSPVLEAVQDLVLGMGKALHLG